MPLDGLQVGRYRLLHVLGAGGMGEVYLAEDTHISRQVAIKIMRSEGMSYPDTMPEEDIQRLFLREVKAIAALQHPYILPLFDYGDSEREKHTFSYMVMPYCQEGSLETWLRRDGNFSLLSLSQIAHILEQAADALHYAHTKQIIHQDVKLSNFLIHRWRAPGIPDLFLADFGIAKLLSTHSRTSQSIRGTPIAMAPEQWEGHPVPATDQYALAVMSYQLLTGHPPFQGGPGQIMYQHLTVQAQPPSTWQSKIPPALDTVLLKALMKKPQERFQTVLAFAQAFQQSLPTLSDSEKKESNAYRKHSDVTPTLNTKEAFSGPPPIMVGDTPSSILPTLPSGIPPTLLGRSISHNSTERPIRRGEQMGSHHPGGMYGKGLLVILLVLLLVGGSAGVTFYVTRSSSQPRPTPGPSPRLQKTPLQHDTSIPATQTSAISPAQNGTATAQALPRNPYPPSTGMLTVNDPLNDNTKGSSWEEGTRDQGTCTFAGNRYHAAIPLTGYFHSCLALSTNFNSFAFEVQMNLVSSSAGGVVFRADRTTTHLYYFTVDRNGGYLLKAYYDKIGDAKVIASGSGIIFNETESIGVVAQRSTISLYVNRQRIQQIQDETFLHGQVGVVTYEGETVFSNAKVWVL